MSNHLRPHIRQQLCVALSVLALSPLNGAWATEASTTQDLSPAPAYAAVCSDVEQYRKKTDDELKAMGLSEPLRQRISYCNAAKQATMTRDFSWAIAGAQSAATVVCTTSCIAGMIGSAFSFGAAKNIDRVCTGVSIASNVTEMSLNGRLEAEAKEQFNVSKYIMPALTLGKDVYKLVKDIADAVKAAKTGAETAKTVTEKSTMEKIEACAGAAMLAFQAGMSYSEVARQNAADGPIQNNLRSAAAQISIERKSGVLGNDGSLYGSNQNNTQAVTTPTAQTPTAGSDDSACAGAVQNFSPATVATCSAAVVGADVPTAYLSGEFSDTFTKITGQDLASYIKNGPADYAGTLSGALNQELGAEKAARVGEGLKKFQSDVNQFAQKSSAQYFAAAGAARARGSRTEKDPLAGIADLMKGLMPGGAGPAKDTGPSAAGQKYGMATTSGRMPASGDGDPNVSLFDRVSDAYRVAGHKTGIDQAAQWTSPINRASHGLR